MDRLDLLIYYWIQESFSIDISFVSIVLFGKFFAHINTCSMFIGRDFLISLMKFIQVDSFYSAKITAFVLLNIEHTTIIYCNRYIECLAQHIFVRMRR